MPAVPLFSYDSIPEIPPPNNEDLLQRALTGSPPPSGDLDGSPATQSARLRSRTPSNDDLAVELVSSTPARRRRADEMDDLGQHAEWAAQHVRLKPAGAQELKRVAQLDRHQREILTTAMLLKLQEQIESIIPADAQWSISENLKEKIELYTFTVLCSPKLALYVDKQAPTKLVLGILERHPSWGYTKDIKCDKYKRDIIAARVGTRLSDRRSDIKETIMLSLGPDGQPAPSSTTAASGVNKQSPQLLHVVDLCQAIIDKGPNSICEDVKVTLQMCARVAFLRKILAALIMNPRAKFDKYWNIVDAQLITLRAIKDDAKINQQLTLFLTQDLELYGNTSLPSAADGAIAHETQRVAEQAISGSLD
ncbi:uncharacterized protein TRAVEDRAFT_52251 [Trametes versicolor FP-101664 SS1]|uniref:uncharacterized protein n=1 Tax=Trametes versicolor (strain FP-101664) TaxID=717944 RepID=UPI0004622C7D|nr:uncharacterized protein TRAVEDRAFT_52251 [Trametes versicolor FP-101664 SS1]EIW54555.1 hypothetical protein TRAVEDRAFT_52251 [Trametes versicolor FP-101664 SS1]